MSLQVEERRRGRSRSPGGRERDRSRSRGPPIDTAVPYPDDRDRERDRDRDRDRGSRTYEYEDDRYESYMSPRSPVDDSSYRRSREAVDVRYSDGRGHEKEYRYEKERTGGGGGGGGGSDRAAAEDKLSYLPQKYASKSSAASAVSSASHRGEQQQPDRGDRYGHGDRDRDRYRNDDDYRHQTHHEYDRDRDRDRAPARDKDRSRKDRYDEDDLAYGSGVPPQGSSGRGGGGGRADSPPSGSSYAYAQPKQWEYAKTEEKTTYSDRSSRDNLGVEGPRRGARDPSPSRGGGRESNSNLGVEPRRGARDPSPSRGGGGGRDSNSNLGVEPRRGARDPSPSRGGGSSTTTTTRETSYHHESSYSSGGGGGGDPRGSSASVLTVEPGSGRKGGMARERSPGPPTQRMASLSVNTGHHSMSLSAGAAPASPLLESYHGTYQSMSPMPSPLLLASAAAGGMGMGAAAEIMDISPLGSDDERGGGSGGSKKKRRARFADPEEDAERLAKALKGDKHRPDTAPLIEILPGLTHDQVMELRVEYKRLVKTGPERKGVNIAKHIRARLKDEDPSLMKACYATALGRWESEAYWANFWYQGDKTRRELLIESLMGRTNAEVRQIKESFNDKKYDNSLSKCMRTELKEDKFKKAVLLVLEERRMEDRDRHGRPLPIDSHLVEDDARALHKAVKAEKGGETAMINIVVERSDAHLREVLKLYNVHYGSNFARDALKKSGNLVGELLAHILNGVINKPVRDALLLHHALTASKKDGLRRELLISRLVRFHWDRHHMAAVKAAYRERYGKDLQEAVRDATAGSEWGQFCQELCIARMPDDVKKIEKITIRS